MPLNWKQVVSEIPASVPLRSARALLTTLAVIAGVLVSVSTASAADVDADLSRRLETTSPGFERVFFDDAAAQEYMARAYAGTRILDAYEAAPRVVGSGQCPAPNGLSALVVGGTRGIGLAIARACLAEGAKVSICGRTQDSLDAALAELGGDAPADHVQGAICDVGASTRVVAQRTSASLGQERISRPSASGTGSAGMTLTYSMSLSSTCSSLVVVKV